VVTAIADTITVLHHGAHLATGTPQQITADPAVNQLYHRPRDAGAGQVVR
jgi:ABC-type branched-subunit amino acid transport system ATPase component